MIRYPVTIDGESVAIGTAAELSAALDVLQGRADRAVLEQLRPHLAAIVSRPADLVTVMRSLSAGDQVFLIDAIGASLPAVLRSARHLRDLLAIVGDAGVRHAIVHTLGSAGLRALVHTPADLAGVLEWLYGQEDVNVLDLLGADEIARIVRNGSELGVVLCALDERGQAAIIERLGWSRIVSLVDDGRDLTRVMRALPPAMSVALLERYSRADLVALVRNPSDWAYLHDRLEPAEAEALAHRLGGR